MQAIVAVSENWGIGKDNQLLFRISAGLKRFKALTAGQAVVMGRKTLQSLPGCKGLPNRRNIVLTRQDIGFAGAERFSSLPAALEACRDDEEVFVIGGASVYREALPLADKLYIPHISDTPAEADAFFPAIDPAVWEETAREEHPVDEKHAFAYRFTDYRKR